MASYASLTNVASRSCSAAWAAAIAPMRAAISTNFASSSLVTVGNVLVTRGVSSVVMRQT